MKLSETDGKALVSIARESIIAVFEKRNPKGFEKEKKKLDFRSGVFVTLEKDGELRGCIGFIDGVLPLWKAVEEAAAAAAFEDPRFKPLEYKELKRIKVEVSVLGKPELLKHGRYAESIEIGKHGLIAEKGMRKGLLLPQVFAEYCSSPEEALDMICMKSLLAPDEWKSRECKIYRFSAEIFSEKAE